MFKKIIISILLIFGLFSLSNSSFAWSLYNEGNTDSIYKNIEKGLETGIAQVGGTIEGIETKEPFSDYVQRLVVYFLGFLSLIAVIYIIYAGINIMISGGDEDKLKSQKKTIISVIIGIVVIWLAYSIVLTVFNWLGDKQTGGGTTYQQADD